MNGTYTAQIISADTNATDMEAYYHFHVRLMQCLGKQAKTYEQYAKRAHELLSKPNRGECIIKLNDKVIGWIGVDVYESDNNRRCLAFDGDFLAPLTDTDFYNDFKETVLQVWKKEMNAEQGYIKVSSAHKQYVADFLQGTLLDEMRYMDIKVADVDAALLEDWIKHTDLTGLTEVFSLYVPEVYMEKYVTAMNAGLCDIPTAMRPFTLFTTTEIERQNMVERKAGGRRHLLLMLINHANNIVAMSNVTVWQSGTTKQWMTYTIPEYRGRNLGKYLKARMMQIILADYPEVTVVQTDCYKCNKAMITINEKMGYAYTKSAFDYKVEIA